MNTARRSVLVVLATVVAVLGLTGSASAAVAPTGYDVSYPQCGKPLPSSQAFGVVGVNGGLATTANPCLAAQLTWAWKSSGAVAAQPKAQVYLNTANPGEIRTQVKTWPTAGSTPYGTCDGSNSSACSWQYGWERAQNSVLNIFTPAAHAAAADSRPASYTWWLDVETGNTWQSGSSAALTRNRATLEGMTAFLSSVGARIGLYSTTAQWGQIAGTVPATSTLAARNSWLAGATTLTGANTLCTKPALTPGGRVTLAQYVQSGLDRDHSCG
jgi:hypothetical protein